MKSGVRFVASVIYLTHLTGLDIEFELWRGCFYFRGERFTVVV